MNQNWIVENLNNAFSTWNGKLTELWGLVTTSPQTFKGGAVWGVMQSLHNAMIGIGYALIVLFFAISLFKNTANFHELKRPEAAVHYLIRFVAAKTLVGYGMDIMLNIFSICNGVVSDLPPYHFKGLPVLLIHPKQKTGEHDNDHHHCRSRRPDAAFEQKEKRHAHERRQPKTNKLPLCQIEKHLGFNFRQILWHVYIGHALTPFRKRNIACNFIAPCVPARRFLPGEQLHAGQIAHERKNLVPRFIRLFTVLLNGTDDKLMYACRLPFGFALDRQQTDFRIAACPVAHAVKP